MLGYMGYLALLPAIGFLVIYSLGLRKSGAETFGAPIWWNDLRPLHGFLYLMFAWCAINGDRTAWLFLLVDVLLGLIGFVAFHSAR
jgi:hypothetical protein